MPFARTKIQRPARRHGAQVERPALERRLGEALLQRRLVLLVAAAGYGKTTALARQCELLPAGTAVAWIACDPDDAPATLFECLVAALEPFDPPWRTDPAALMRLAADATRAEQRRAVATEVINALDACEVPHGVIVVDDLHRIEHPAVHAFLGDLLERLSPRWTFAIASRREPPIASLARLRVQGEVAEFRLDDLRFEREEARTLSSAEGVSAEHADRLHERTQGWPAGLRLALNAQRGTPPERRPGIEGGVIDRHVFDFLADEVIDRLAPPLRDFLLRTSVLPELTAARAAALSRDALAAQRLEEIEREGLFVSAVAADEPTLRLHDLFRGALEARFRRERPDEYEASLAAAAATEPDPLRRAAWWLRARRWADAEATLVQEAEGLVAAGLANELDALFERFPPEVRAASARLRLVIARSRWRWDQAFDAATQAAAAFDAAGDAQERLAALSYRCVALAGGNLHEEARAAVRALLAEPALEGDALARTLAAAAWVEAARGDQRAVAPLLARVNDTLEDTPNLSRWNESAPLGPLAGLPGARAPLERWVAGAFARMPDQPSPLRGKAHLMQAWLRLLAGDVEGAEASVRQADADARWLARPVELDAPLRSVQAVIDALHGRTDDALEALASIADRIEASGMRFRIEVYLSLYLFLGVRCAALADRPDAVRRFASRLAHDADRRRDWLSPAHLASVPAHVAAAEGRLEDACATWERIVADPWHGDIYGQAVESALRLADARLRLGAPAAAAASALASAFERIDASGEWGAALFAGRAVLRRLADAPWGTALDGARRASLARWADCATALAAGRAVGDEAIETAASVPDDGRLAAVNGAVLTGREVEVLARIAAGDSNKLIARALELSPHTVKRHVANILDKLAVESRGQAAAWYREVAQRSN